MDINNVLGKLTDNYRTEALLKSLSENTDSNDTSSSFQDILSKELMESMGTENMGIGSLPQDENPNDFLQIKNSSRLNSINSSSIMPTFGVNNYANISNLYNKNTNSPIDTKPLGELKNIFKNDLFIGDSITKGISAYNVLGDDKVCAKVGNTTNAVSKMVDDLPSSKNPKRIFVMCGVNDVGSLSTQQFAKNYSDLVNKIKSKFPNSKIYIQSILPVSQKAENTNPYLSNNKINEYNKALSQISQSEKVGFVNTASIVKGNDSLHASDGVHFSSSFYPMWLSYLNSNC